jgi:hypothetical protein
LVDQGQTKQFSAVVSGTNSPAQTVTWSIVESVIAGTAINTDGLLTVAAGETATSLTVRATSTVDTGKSGTASVGVLKHLSSLVLALTQTDYGIGEPLAFTLTATYTDTTNADISTNVDADDFLGYNPLSAGSQTISITIGSVTSNTVTLTIKTLAERIVPTGTYTLTLYGNESFAAVLAGFPSGTVNIGAGKDITLISSDTGSEGERIIQLTGNGAMFYLYNGGKLTLGTNVTLKGHNTNTQALVYMYGPGNSFTMNGGKISGNSGNNGGGVYLWSSTFTMNNGEISGNTAYNGGGVYLWSSTFTMNGGKISGNTANTDGGGVFLMSSTFTMTGGEISGNTANNTANTGGGGGVYALGPTATFTMSSGEIFGNSAYSYGGAIRILNARFTKIGGTIYGYPASPVGKRNIAVDAEGAPRTGYGHAVYAAVWSDGVMGVKRWESTAAPGVELGCQISDDGTTGSFTGSWEY